MSTSPGIIRIERPNDDRIEDYRAVQDRDTLGPEGRPGLFVGETRLIIDRMLALPGVTKSVLVEERHAESMRATMDAAGAADVPLFIASERILEGIAGFNVHRGALAIGRRPSPDRWTLDVAVPRREQLTLLLCDNINSIDNIGGLYRNAAAFGVDAVVLSARCHDPLYRKCLRVSMGHALAIPTARSAHWDLDLERLRREWRVTLLGASIGPGSRPLDEVELPERVAIIVGSEFAGLGPESLRACDSLVRIPMAAGIDSLNVSVAAAVCLHRFSRSARR